MEAEAEPEAEAFEPRADVRLLPWAASKASPVTSSPTTKADRSPVSPTAPNPSSSAWARNSSPTPRTCSRTPLAANSVFWPSGWPRPSATHSGSPRVVVGGCGGSTEDRRGEDGGPVPAALERRGPCFAHTGADIRRWAKKNKVEPSFTPTYASWANPSRRTSARCGSSP